MHLIIGDDTAFVVSILLILSLLAPARITLVAMLSFTTQLGALRSRYIFSKTRKFTEAPVTENKVLTTYTLQHRYSTSTPNFGDSPTFFFPHYHSGWDRPLYFNSTYFGSRVFSFILHFAVMAGFPLSMVWSRTHVVEERVTLYVWVGPPDFVVVASNIPEGYHP